jgi:hypothetical protein
MSYRDYDLPWPIEPPEDWEPPMELKMTADLTIAGAMEDWAHEKAMELDNGFFSGHRGLYVDEIRFALRDAWLRGWASGSGVKPG